MRSLRTPSARRVGLAVLFALVVATSAVAEERRGPAFTAVEAGPLGRATLVVVGQVDGQRGARGMSLVTLRIEQTLKGTSPGPTVMVMVRGPRPTATPEAPSAPYFQEGASGRFVVFLVRGSGSSLYRLDTLFEVDGTVGEEKVRAVEAAARLAAIPDPEARARQTLEYLVDALGKGGVWSRVNASRELNHFVGLRPDLFDDATRHRLRAVLQRSSSPTQRTWLHRLLERLEESPSPLERAPEAEEPGDGHALLRMLKTAADAPERITMLQAFLDRHGPPGAAIALEVAPLQEPEVRFWIVTTLAEGGYRDVLPRIRAAYAAEDDASVQSAIVRAVGFLGGADDVAWLEARLANPRVLRPVLFALARIRTDRAVAILARSRVEAQAEGDGFEDIPALVDYLLSPAFEDAERAEGRRIGGT